MELTDEEPGAGSEPSGAVPITARAQFAHAALQVLALESGVDLLHIKGAALDSRLRAARHGGTDADVLVRPSHVGRFVAAIGPRGWNKYAGFATGSAFEHAATFWHDYWGYADVHRFFPGVGLSPEAAFDVLWRDRHTTDIAGFACNVPDFAAQALLLVLHAGRSSGGAQSPDVKAWRGLSEAEKDHVAALRGELKADIAFAAGTGHLEDFVDHPEYDLWAHFSSGETSRSAEWRARIKAAPTRTAAARLVVRSLLVNRDHLAQTLGHQPSHREVAAAFLQRGRIFVTERFRPPGSP